MDPLAGSDLVPAERLDPFVIIYSQPIDGGRMVVSAILKRFMEQSPIPVMARSLLERVLTPAKLNNWFDKVAKRQYTRDLLFSSILELMSLVVMKSFPSVNAAYQSEKANIGVSIASVYNKLNCLEEKVLATLVRDTSQELSELIGEMDGACAPLLPGYRVKMLDGVCHERKRKLAMLY